MKLTKRERGHHGDPTISLVLSLIRVPSEDPSLKMPDENDCLSARRRAELMISTNDFR